MKINKPDIHKELVEKSKFGDRNSQYQLYELYVDAMYNTAVRMLGSKEDAEDIIQESFVEAFKKLESFRFESSFGSWLKRIVINKSINFLKSKKIQLIPIEQNEFLLKDTIEEEQTDPRDIEKVKHAIQLLPTGYKQIICLYLLEGYDHTEIAEILDITSSTSKSQYHRAKKKLVEIIDTL